MTEREMKKCPDCAEAVLTEARKCRYCGFRFDGGRSGPASSRSGLLGLFKKSAEPLSPSELLADWGVELDRGEEVAILAFGHVKTEHGYLVATDRRFLFLEHHGARNYRKLFEWPIETLTEVDLSVAVRRRLRLRGGGYEIVVLGLRPDVSEQLRTHLQARLTGLGRQAANP